MLRTPIARRYLPVASDTLPAGFPSPAEDYVDRVISLDEELIHRPSSTFLLRVKGNDHQGYGIWDGDIIIVDRSLRPKRGDFVVGVEGGQFVVVKWISKTEEIELWGTVTSAIRRFRHA